MKRYYYKLAILLLFAAVAFGLGIGVAEIHIRYFTPIKKYIPVGEPVREEINNVAKNLPEQPARSGETEYLQEGKSQPDNNPDFSFAILGDTQSFSAGNPKGNLQKAVAFIAKRGVSFSFVVGDLISDCDGGNKCEAKYNDWKRVMGPLVNKTYEVMGNHDKSEGNKADTIWQKTFGNLPSNGPSGFSKSVYSFDFENTHFVVLNSEKPEENIIDNNQRNWLEQDLNSHKKEHTFVFFHEPAFQTSIVSKHGLDAKPSERDALWAILAKHRVDAVFNGHDHIYTRSSYEGVYQIVIGNTDSDNLDIAQPGLSEYSYSGKSYIIVSVNGQKINVSLYSVDGNLINSFDMKS